MSYQAYQKAQQSSETPSQVEYRLFVQVTNSLITARDNGLKGTKLVGALDWNRRMWSVFSSDCGAKGNSLPDQLRASIMSLSIWVSKHSSKVVRENASIDDLININKTIMEGLAAQAKLQQQANTAQKDDPSSDTAATLNSIL